MLADGYTRYSTDRQTENSTAYQRAKIKEYCAQNDITLRTIHSDEAKRVPMQTALVFRR